ncbi:type IX secretion system sortase PorU [bacterium]|nr:type IX secretion system sortase PorU [bacterium]
MSYIGKILFLVLSVTVILGYPLTSVETADGIELTWIAPKLDTTEIDGSMLLIQCKGADISGVPGSPGIPRYRIPIALPTGDLWSFELISELWEPFGRARLAPVPTWQGFPDGPYYEDYIIDTKTYSENHWFPFEKEAFSETGHIRGIKIGHLEVYPIRFNPVSEELERLVDFKCKVAYSTSSEMNSPTLLEKTVIGFVANPQSALTFIKTKPKRRPSRDLFTLTDSWFTFPIIESGLFKIDRDYVLSMGYNPSEIDPSEIRLFDEGWMELPTGQEPELPSLEEIPLYPVGLTDGSFDSGDALYFYGRGPSGWFVEETRLSHHLHRFTSANYYWVTIGGDFPEPSKRLTKEEISAHDTTSFGKFLHFVENDYVYAKTGNDIQWGSERTTEKHISLLDSRIDTTNGVYVRHRVVPVADETRPIVYATANGYSPDSTYSIWTGAQSAFFGNAFSKNANSIDIDFLGTSALFDYYEILYQIELVEYNESLEFLGRDTASAYLIAGFDSEPLVFDVTGQNSLRLLKPYLMDDGKWCFSDSLGSRHYFISERSSALRLDYPILKELAELRERSFDSELLMLIPEGLESDIDEYITYRESRGTTVDWVFVEDVLEEFGFGTKDPTAIRDFLRYLWLYSDYPPEHILLVGDATWDPRGITNPPETFCPAALCVSNAPDDYFYAVTEGDGIPDYSGGRIPITTINEWRNWVEKLMRTEGNPDFGTWRTRFVYCADDERKTGNLPDTWQHTTQVSSYVRDMPAWTEPRTVYLIDYPLTSSGLKPGAQKALLEKWNDGSVLVNYVGHGNYRLWTHEEAFEATSCISKLENKWKLPLMVSASCEVGLFYRTVGQCIAEQVVLFPEAGAVAAIAATRMTLSPSNGSLNARLLDICWGQNQKAQLGPALFYAKGGDSWASTRGQYVLFGDPAMEIGAPKLDIVIDLDRDSLIAGVKTHVTGEVLSDSAIVSDFNGTAYILVYDSGYYKNYSNSPYLSGSVSYFQGGKRLFVGPVSVRGGLFEGEFVVPIDVSYGTEGGKVVVYAYDNSDEAVGYFDEMIVAGDTTLVIEDSLGPEVDLSFDGHGFSNDGVICDGGELICTVSDENGINLSGAAGHALTMTLDGNESNALDLSQYFEYRLDSYQVGEAHIPLEDLSFGKHTVRVKAWDNIGNSGEAEMSFEVADCEIIISNPLAYPNPFRSDTELTFNIGVYADITINIYTLTGRPVRKLESSVYPAFAMVHWDGKDSRGTPVANGAYLVKIEARTVDGYSDEKVFKIAKLR